MTFSLTKYIFPLKEAITLSASQGLVLDNPKTPEEIEIVKRFIGKTIEDKERNTKLYHFSETNIDFIPNFLSQKKDSIDGDISYAASYFLKSQNNLKRNTTDTLAEAWIIIRFPEDDEFIRVSSDIYSLYDILLIKQNSPYADKFKNMASYCHVLSLLTNTKGYNLGESFLLCDNPYELFFPSTDGKVMNAINEFQTSVIDALKTKNWLYWIDGKEYLLECASRLETLIIQETKIITGVKVPASQKQTPEQKLLHIGNLLKAAFEHQKDLELTLLLLVSIIEYIVVKDTDEESINKQFKRKCAELICKQSQEFDLDELSSKLGKIYDQRSDFAHGNYKKLDIEKTIESVNLLYEYNRNIINKYILNRDLVDSLKDN